jgi:malate dehydrogenase (oxaloacetate-decarboxylating)
MSIRQSLVTYTKEEALNYHANNFGGGGKIEVISKVPTRDVKDLTLAYSPGVAEVCRAIAREPDKIHDYTIKDNLVAVVTDGTAILGLGNIGPRAGIPVMEGKCVLFKNLAGVDAFPIILDTTDPEQIIMIVRNLEPLFIKRKSRFSPTVTRFRGAWPMPSAAPTCLSASRWPSR